MVLVITCSALNTKHPVKMTQSHLAEHKTWN